MTCYSNYADVQGVKWYYEVHGEGKPALFLHGGLESIAQYKKLFSFLSDHFKVIAVDRRGHGRSYDNDQPYTYAHLAEEVMEFLKVIGITSTMLLGYSDGGNIGLHLVWRYPEHFSKFIAVSPNYRVEGGMLPEFIYAVQNFSKASLSAQFPHIVTEYEALNPQPDFDRYLQKGKPMWLTDPILEKAKMEQIQVPTLFIGGDRDIIPLEHLIEMYRLIKNARLSILPNTSHFVFQDFAFQENTKAVLEQCKNFLLE